MGALSGVRVVELAAVGPVPFAGMVLADLGAEITRVDRLPGADPYAGAPGAGGPLGRGRRSIAVDLRHPEGAALVRDLAAESDVLLEGWRPGVAERLGLGPQDVLGLNPRLVYGRMTGFGQSGPLAAEAGHDLTYLAYSGVLGAVGESGSRPVPPLNLVADFGGGAMSLVTGVLAALVERGTSQRGQVVDVAMTDAAAYLATMTRHMLAVDAWRDERGVNLLDGGAPHYRCYRTADDKYVAIGALEPQFWRSLLEVLGLSEADVPSPYDSEHWPELTERITEVVVRRSRDDWAAAAAGTDACLAPVLDWSEAAKHPHNVDRGSYAMSGGAQVARPPARLSRTPADVAAEEGVPGEDTDRVLGDAGLTETRIDDLRRRGVVA